jgi:phenylpropionate dioxygenase-like ring-hydroxylating dioxygenase large terminal subunit
MQRSTGLELMRRALDILESGRPELADRYLHVPLDYYKDPGLDERERRIFETEPLALVAASEVARPHDYVVRDAVGRSVLITRDEEGVAHAFLNYCRHRGAEPASGCGNRRGFACPYHGWTYDTKGRLIGLPLQDRYADLDRGRLGLVELPSEERHGFVWVVLTPGDPIDVAAHLGPFDADLASLGIERMSYYNSLPGEPLAAGWKCVAEGLLEGLHVPFVHKGTFDQNPQAPGVDLAFYDTAGSHVRYGMPIFGTGDIARLRATPESEWDPDTQVGCIWWISPGLLLANELYGLIYADLTPGPDPDSSTFRYGWLSPTTEAPEGLPGPDEMAKRAAVAVGQDKPVWEGCWRGIVKGAQEAMLIGRNEKGLQLFHEMHAKRVGYEGLRYSAS